MDHCESTFMFKSTYSKSYYEHFRDFNENIYLCEKCNCCYTSHFHRNIELHYTTSGMTKGTINKNSYTYEANDLVLIPSYAIHSFSTPEKSTNITFIIPHNYSHDFDSFFANRCFDFPLTDKEYNKDYILPILQHLLRLVKISKNQKNDFALKGLTISLIGCILNHYKPNKNEGDLHKGSEHIIKVLDYIEKNYNKEITLDKISKDFGYSKDHFSKLFNKYVQFSLSDYINSVKVDHVLNKLIDNNFTDMLNTIFECGFNSPSTFYRAFDKRYKMSIKEFIKQFQEKDN